MSLKIFLRGGVIDFECLLLEGGELDTLNRSPTIRGYWY